jgi:hypothetical protein
MAIGLPEAKWLLFAAGMTIKDDELPRRDFFKRVLGRKRAKLPQPKPVRDNFIAGMIVQKAEEKNLHIERRAFMRNVLELGLIGALGGLFALFVNDEQKILKLNQIIEEVKAAAPPEMTTTPDWIDFAVLSSRSSASIGRMEMIKDVGGTVVNPSYSPDGSNWRDLRPEQAATYVIFVDPTDSNKIKARNGTTGAVDYSGTDAATVIQEAISGLPATYANARIFIREGTYLMNSALTLNTQNLTIEGVLGGTRLQANSSIDKLFDLSDPSNLNLLFRNFAIRGASSINDASMLNYAFYCYRPAVGSTRLLSVWENVTVENTLTRGWALLDGAEDCALMNPFFHSNNGIGLEFNSGGQCRIFGGTFYGSPTNHIYLSASGGHLLCSGTTSAGGCTGPNILADGRYSSITLDGVWAENNISTPSAPLVYLGPTNTQIGAYILGGSYGLRNSTNSYPVFYIDNVNGAIIAPAHITYNYPNYAIVKTANAKGILLLCQSLSEMSVSRTGQFVRISNDFFLSNENKGNSTGTGAQQTIAHNLAAAPTLVLLSEGTTGGAFPYQSAPADATNIYITATLNKTYTWYAKV